jgi:hypothetical protein
VKAISPYVELCWTDVEKARGLGISTAMQACLEKVWPAEKKVRPAPRRARG